METGNVQAMKNSTALVEGILLEAGSDKMVLELPGTDYRLHLAVTGKLPAELIPGPGGLVRGTIRARVKRVDRTGTGGRYVEPVYGRPRRIQGMVIAADPAAQTLAIQCAPGCAMICALTMGQKAGDFTVGTLVTTEVERGASFEAVQDGPRLTS